MVGKDKTKNSLQEFPKKAEAFSRRRKMWWVYQKHEYPPMSQFSSASVQSNTLTYFNKSLSWPVFSIYKIRKLRWIVLSFRILWLCFQVSLATRFSEHLILFSPFSESSLVHIILMDCIKKNVCVGSYN